MAWRSGHGFAAAGLIVAPAVWAIHQQADYVLVPASCKAQILVIPFVTLLALALIAAGAWISGSRPESGTSDSTAIPDTRRRTSSFLSNVSVLASAVFFMAVLLQGVAALILGSCER